MYIWLQCHNALVVLIHKANMKFDYLSLSDATKSFIFLPLSSFLIMKMIQVYSKIKQYKSI